EVRALGAQSARETVAGVHASGNLELGYRLCLWSRLANRVLLILQRFPADSAQAMYDGVATLDWADHLASDGTLAVDVRGTLAGDENTNVGALPDKHDLVDRERTPSGERHSVDKVNPQRRINGHCRNGAVQLALDLSGNSLHQRGYRLHQGAAPLKKNLAAA